MNKVVKQVAGVDVAQKELVVTLGKMHGDFSITLYAHKVFKNTDSGILALIKWANQLTDSDVNLHFVMEATGVYHQKFAYFLDENKHAISIVLPNKISNYMKTLDSKTVTDKTSSEAIAQFGLERKLELWHRPNKTYKVLQQLTREREQVVAERAMVKNQLHAELSEAFPNSKSLERIKDRIKFLNRQEAEIKRDITETSNEDQSVKSSIEKIATIPGVGKLTAAIVLAETNGFELVRNKKQLTSYAGFDVREKQSGTSIKGKTKISKKGNKNLRKAMHLPSLSAVKYIEDFKNIYARIVAKHGIKMKALVAVQRKLLELIFVIFNGETGYRKDYKKDRVLCI